jgi:CARDB
MNKCLFLLLCCAAPCCLWADSPLTSTFFAPAYKELPEIQRVLQLHDTQPELLVLDSDVLSFLDAVTNSWDQKVAMVNALGWGSPANTNAYCDHLANKYMIARASVDSLLNGNMESLNESGNVIINFTARGIAHSDLLILAYLQAMGDYFQPLISINIIEYVYASYPSSQAVALVGSLIAAQFLMDLDWCAVYHCTDILYNESYDRDFIKPEALAIVESYMQLYSGECDAQTAMNDNTAFELVDESPAITGDARVFDLAIYVQSPVYHMPTTKQALSKQDYVDLELRNKVKKNEMVLYQWVKYNESFEGTELELEIHNNGTIASIETNVLIRLFADLDREGDVESYFQEMIPPIPAGTTHRMSVIIPGYWIYDPNAHFSIELDFDNNIEEKNETNNGLTVFEWG